MCGMSFVVFGSIVFSSVSVLVNIERSSHLTMLFLFLLVLVWI